MVVPLLILGLFISILITFFGEYILPKAENKREKIYNINIRKREVEDIKLRPNIYYSDDKFMYYIGFFDGYTNKMRVVDITERDENNRIKRKIMANDAVWDFDHWVFHAVHERHFENGELTTYIFEDEHILPDISVEPKDFVKSAKKPMEMNYFELKEYVQRLKKIDEKHTKEETDLHFKLSFPLANFIILLFCVPLASASIRSKGRGVIFLLGIVICVIYLMLLRICQSLGYNQIISPLVAAWLPHLFFLFVGAIVVYKSEI
jgi:lipopolysaccharide export system permease protein